MPITIPVQPVLQDWTQGTSNFTAGSEAVSFSGAGLVSVDSTTGATLYACSRGDIFYAGNYAAIVASVVDANDITLLTPWPGSTLTAQTYGIIRLSRPLTGQLAAICQALLNQGSASNPYQYQVFDDGTARFEFLNAAGQPTIAVGASGAALTSLVKAIQFDPTTGAATYANQRTPVSDAAYTGLSTDRLIAYRTLTAARTVTLPAANAYPAGHVLAIVDESGNCSATNKITIAAAGSNTINGGATWTIQTAYGTVMIESNGSTAWTVVEQNQTAMVGDSGSGGQAGYAPAAPAGSAASNMVLGAGGAFVPQLAGNRNRLRNAQFAINQRGVSGTVSLGAGAYGHDGVKGGAAGCTYTFSSAGLDTTLNITAGSLILPIESSMIEGGDYVLSQGGTAQARVWQGSGSTGSGSYASAPFVTASLTAATQTNVEFSTGTVVRPQLEPGTIAAAATAFSRRLPGEELALNMRYYQILSIFFTGYNTAGGTLDNIVSFAVPMRAAPTVTFNASPGYGNSSGETSIATGTTEIVHRVTVTATGAASINSGATLSAEI